MTDPDQEALDVLAFGMWLQGHRLDAETANDSDAGTEEPVDPGPRAPRPDPSQGAQPNANPNAALDFAHLINTPAAGDGGWRPLH